MKVYIITNDDYEILGATLSKTTARKILKENADLETPCVLKMDLPLPNEPEDLAERVAKQVEDEFQAWCDNVLESKSCPSIYRVWCEVVELTV